ncbi:MAG: MurR/RpiR family transcriptional regulator [Mycoplasmatales bacterium]
MEYFDLEKKLQNYETSSNKAFATLANFLLNYQADYKNLKIIQICNELYISNATPTRLAQNLGLSGFNELKILLENNKLQENLTAKQYENKDLLYYIQDISSSLKNSFALFSQEKINFIIQKIIAAQKIKIFAVGGSYISALDFHYKLLRINLPCFIESDRHVQHYLAKNLTPKDVAIGISYSGLTKEVLKGLEIAKKNGAYTILITSNVNINPDKYDEIVYIKHDEISTRGFSIISRTTVIAILDIIYINILNSNSTYYYKILRETRFKDY